MTLIGIACALGAAFLVATGGRGLGRSLVVALAALVAGGISILAYAMFVTSTQYYADTAASLGEPIANQIRDAETWSAFKAVLGVSILAGLLSVARRST